jgi:hypothetical protein
MTIKMAPIERPPVETLSAAGPKPSAALVSHEGKTYAAAVRPGEVWCSICGRSVRAEEVRAHRCEGV